jgi:superfamily II DNA/RNA helicase
MSSNFKELNIKEELCSALEKAAILDATEIQAAAIPEILGGKSIIAQSPTGTGKTLAYLLPILDKIDADSKAVQAVVLAPTQELAMQIFRVASDLAREAKLSVRAASLIGGANISRQLDKLKTKPHIVIGSAGRMAEIMQKSKLKLNESRFLVLDEADRLLDKQNESDTKKIIAAMPKICQYILLSATISDKTVEKAEQFAAFTRLSAKETLRMPQNIEHWSVVCDFRDKIEAVRKLYHALNIKRALVFVNSAKSMENLTEKLKYNKLKADFISAAGNKMLRQKAIADFSKGKTELLLATDVAARGLDIKDVEFVINFDMPENEKVYLHRAGRTGRAGEKGVVITLFDKRELGHIASLEKKLKLNMIAKKIEYGSVRTPAHRAPNAPRARAKQPAANFRR